MAIGMSANASGLRGLCEETVRYFQNTPKELVFVVVCRVGFSDVVWSPALLVLCSGSGSGGSDCAVIANSFAFEATSDHHC